MRLVKHDKVHNKLLNGPPLHEHAKPIRVATQDPLTCIFLTLHAVLDDYNRMRTLFTAL